MATYSEQMQSIFSRYIEETNDASPTARDAAAWAIDNGMWQPKPSDVISQCASDISRALREEYRTDKYGRRYRAKHARQVTQDGKQLTLWSDIDKAPRDHMQKAFAQRRKQVVGDCHQLKIDLDYFNESHPDDIPLQVIFDFTDDLEEMEYLEKVS